VSDDERGHAPATARNREPILTVLRGVLPATGRVLEIASGTGEHVCHFAAALPALEFQPSDPDAGARASQAAWIAHTGLHNVLPPIALRCDLPDWEQHAELDSIDALICINMIHIAPWAAALGLLRGAAALLPDGAPLYLYGPYLREDHPTAESNTAFDASLRARDPSWGIRQLETVIEIARAEGFELNEVVEMPANNLSVVLRRTP
jgi:hypothetical protein